MNRRSLAIGGAAAVVAVGVGGGVAYAASGDSSSQAAAAPAQANFASVQQAADTGKAAPHTKPLRKPLRRVLARRVVHGQFTVKTKDGFRTVQVQQGTVAAVSATSITLVSADHYRHTYTIGSHTRVRFDGEKSAASKLVTGHHARVITAPRYGSNTAGIVIERAK